MSRVERLLVPVFVVGTWLSFASHAHADATATLERLDGDPRGRATVTLRRALEHEGIDIVTDDATFHIEGRVRRGALTLRVNGPDGERRVDVRGDTITELMERGAAAVAPLLVEGHVTAEGAPPREREEEAPSVTEASPRPTHARSEATVAHTRDLRTARTAFVLDVGFTELSRDLAYRDDVYAQLADYHARFAPSLSLATEWYPGAHTGSRSALSWLGLGVSWSRVFGYTSRSADGETRYPTRAATWDADARVRIPIGGHAISGIVGYGREVFFVYAPGPTTPSGNQAPTVPATHYAYVRLGADAYLHLVGGLHLGASAGLRVLTDRGGIDAWFPDNRGVGMDLGARVVLHAYSALRIGVAADYHRYVFGLHPSPGDAHVAGGVSDNFLRVSLFVGVRIPELR